MTGEHIIYIVWGVNEGDDEIEIPWVATWRQTEEEAVEVAKRLTAAWPDLAEKWLDYWVKHEAQRSDKKWWKANAVPFANALRASVDPRAPHGIGLMTNRVRYRVEAVSDAPQAITP